MEKEAAFQMSDMFDLEEASICELREEWQKQPPEMRIFIEEELGRRGEKVEEEVGPESAPTTESVKTAHEIRKEESAKITKAREVVDILPKLVEPIRVRGVEGSENNNLMKNQGEGLSPVQQTLANAGADIAAAAKALKDGLNATEIKTASFQGIISDSMEVPDHAERRQCAKEVLLLYQAYPTEKVSVDHTHRVIRMPAKKECGDGAIVDIDKDGNVIMEEDE